MRLSCRNILSVADLTKKDVNLILDTAESLKEILDRPIKKVPTLRGKTVVNCFFEDSTRTRVSFEIAEKHLSADTVNISKSGSSVQKGETILDTMKNIEAMKPDIIVVRHSIAGAPKLIADAINCHVINAGDGMHEHPTQALLDLMTIRDVKKQTIGLTVGIVGDILHSRVARSNMILLKKVGMKVIVAGPKTMIPVGIESFGVDVAFDIRDIIGQLDVLMVLRMQKERAAENLIPSTREYARYFGVTKEVLKTAKKDIVIMHPGPVNRGIEIAPDIADGERSVILTQVSNGVAVRMALLYLLSGDTTRMS